MGTSAPATIHYSYSDKVLSKARFDKQGNSKVNLLANVDNILVTEGPLKADIISSLAPKTQLKSYGSFVTIAMPGAGMWKAGADKIIEHKFDKAYLAFDQDFEDNNQVYFKLRDMVEYLTFDNNIPTDVLVWETGKGLDDFLLSKQSAYEEILVHRYN